MNTNFLVIFGCINLKKKKKERNSHKCWASKMKSINNL